MTLGLFGARGARPELGGLLLAHHEHRGGPVTDLGRVACCHDAVLLERRAEIAETLNRRGGPETLIGVEGGDHAICLDLDRDDLCLSPKTIENQITKKTKA